MPVWLRKFTAQKITEFNETQNKEIQNVPKGTSSPKIPKGPAIKRPSYSTKVKK